MRVFLLLIRFLFLLYTALGLIHICAYATHCYASSTANDELQWPDDKRKRSCAGITANPLPIKNFEKDKYAFPDDILLEIFPYMAFSDLPALSHTSRQFYHCAAWAFRDAIALRKVFHTIQKELAQLPYSSPPYNFSVYATKLNILRERAACLSERRKRDLVSFIYEQMAIDDGLGDVLNASFKLKRLYGLFQGKTQRAKERSFNRLKQWPKFALLRSLVGIGGVNYEQRLDTLVSKLPYEMQNMEPFILIAATETLEQTCIHYRQSLYVERSVIFTEELNKRSKAQPNKILNARSDLASLATFAENWQYWSYYYSSGAVYGIHCGGWY